MDTSHIAVARDRYIEQLRNSYLDAVVAGNQRLAYGIMGDPLIDQVSVQHLYMDVLLPAQIAVGEMWHAGKINIAQEHLDTSITLGVMEQFRCAMKPRDNLGVRAALAVLGDERHIVGIRMFADFLMMDGWEVDLLIDPTPVRDLMSFIRTRNIDLLALSFTIPDTQSITKVVTDTLKEQEFSPKVLLGGQALNDAKSDSMLFGADGIAKNAIEGVKEAKRLVGLAKGNIDLETHLTDIVQDWIEPT